MWLIYHKFRRLPASTGKLEWLALDVMQKYFYTDLSYCNERQSVVIPLIADIRS